MHYLSLEEIQRAELDILRAFDEVCRANDLRYSLAGGTLLGAVRHRGFIPWDDDIDVAMPRPDYERFRRLAFEKPYAVKGFPNEEDEEPIYCKFVDERIRVKETFLRNDLHLWIDVFPVDGLPASNEEVATIYGKAARYRRLILASHADLARGRTKFRRFAKNALHILDKIVPIAKRSEDALRKLARRYPYEGSPNVGCIVWGLYGVGEKLPADAFSKTVDVEFEGERFPAMHCWDRYLSGIYGNYEQLPPEDQRVAHEMHVWRDDGDAELREMTEGESR